MATYPIKIVRSVGRPTLYSKILEAYAIEIVQWFQNYMLANNRIATGDSISSFGILVMDDQIVIDALESVAFAIQGRTAGKFPNIDKIRKWILAKPVEPYPSANGIIPTLNQLVYLISRGIALKGTAPPKLTPQNITAVITSKGTKYMERIGREQAEEIQQQMIGIFDRSKSYKVTKK